MEKKVVSFVIRNGRITKSQKKYLTHYQAQYSVGMDGWCNWETVFGNHHPVVLDIGFGNGDDLFFQACKYPQYNFVGIEVYQAGIGRLLGKVVSEGLQHVRVVQKDAVEVVSQHIPTNTIARVQLLFPDPWPKKKHHKRRIVQPAFVAELCRVLQVGGVLHIVTDHAGYAAHIDDVLGACEGLRPCGAGEGMIHFDRQPTRFEQRGLMRGHKIHPFSFIKKS
ncbi:MAG: tRNA (guanosine(46)-N7)-methyltransferase TrmB [Cytophagales bacterium]